MAEVQPWTVGTLAVAGVEEECLDAQHLEVLVGPHVYLFSKYARFPF